MNIAILGYGKMGRLVEELAPIRGHEIALRIDPLQGDRAELDLNDLEGCDGIIEFSTHGGILERLECALTAGVPMVIGTTGWNDRLEQARTLVERYNGAALYGSNFSVGANLFFALVRSASQLINEFDEYDIMLNEYHHRQKTDSPSGTALTTAGIILDENKKKTHIVTDTLQRAPADNELHVGSVRGGSIPGIHEVTLDSEADSIEIRHTARSRRGFASGAIRALEWLSDKKGFYSATDFFSSTGLKGA